MSKNKSNFSSFLTEFDGTATNAFSANVLQHTQLTQDPERDEEEKKKDKEMKLRKEIEASLTDGDDSNLVDDDNSGDTKNQRILKHLKNLLYREPGYSSFTGEDSENEESDDSDVVYNDGRELMNGDQPVTQPGYKDQDDPNNPHKQPDNEWVHDDGKDNHEQLIAAIKDLRDELRQARTGGAVEQEEASEEDEGDDETQFANAGKLFQSLVNQKMSRGNIIAQFEKNLGVTNSTATSYYQRLAKNAGLTNAGADSLQQPPQQGGMGGFQDPNAAAGGGAAGPQAPQETNVSGNEVPNDPNRQGLIRSVKGAHLVYKRQNEEGTFDELWVFGTGNEMEDALKVRRNILAGTDIPPRATKSQNGAQSYTLKTLGNGQILHIKGLPN